MRKHALDGVLVTDSDGRLLGLVTRAAAERAVPAAAAEQPAL
jgi:CBS domain-containing protein